MKRCISCLRMLASASLIAFCVTPAPAGDRLSQRELRGLFPGNFDAVVYGMLEVKIVAHGNGELIGLLSGKKVTGHWSVSNGRLCIMLSDRKATCSEVVASDGWYHGGGVRFRRQ